ncbi:MAG: LysE family translocator [Pseudomonadota bacterium]
MLPIEQLIAFTVIFATDSITPGPAVAAVLARSATSSAVRTIPFVTGLVVGDLIVFGLAVAGLAALAAALGPVFCIIKWAGIAYLLYLAYRLWTATPAELTAQIGEGAGTRSFWFGAMLPLGNPKAIGFYVALLPAILDPTVLTWAACIELAVVISVVWFGVLYGYTIAGDRASRMIKTPRAQVVLNRCSAGAMIGAAGTIAAQR